MPGTGIKSSLAKRQSDLKSDLYTVGSIRLDDEDGLGVDTTSFFVINTTDSRVNRVSYDDLVSGIGSLTVSSKTSAYTITSDDDVILCDGTFTVTLPTAVGISGTSFYVKNIGTGSITLDGDGSETIDGSTTILIPSLASRHVVSDGTQWWII